MNREIKFRIWDKKQNKFWHDCEGITQHGTILTAEGNVGLVVDPLIKIEENKDDKKVYIFDKDFLVVQEFIDLKDKNGREIFEGDVIADPDDVLIDNVVRFNMGVFGVTAIYDLLFCPLMDWEIDKLEVIGNCFENKELIKKESPYKNE